jgi:uroporphyrinogen-III synthase
MLLASNLLLQKGRSVTDIGFRPVVITRPAAQAQYLADQINACGRQAVLFPLLCIAPLEDGAPLQAALAQLLRYALVVFVSPNAIDAAFAHVRQWPPALAIGIVGEGSRMALLRHGIDDTNATIFAPAAQARMDSEALFQALDLNRLRGKRVLIVRGQAGRDFLSEMLSAAQVEVEHVSAYQRLAPSLTPAMTQQLQALLNVDSEWIVTSSEALRNLIQLTMDALGATAVAKIQQQRIVVSHQRIAETAQSQGFSRVTMSGSGDERLIAALQSPA